MVKKKEYPILDPQALLHLIKANQTMIIDLEDRVLRLENKK